MNMRWIKLYRYEMELVHPFRTHAGIVRMREGILVQVVDEHNREGWGEGVAFTTPFYTHETVQSSWDMLTEHFIPVLKQWNIQHPTDIARHLTIFQGNQMAKAAMEAAVWDLYAKQQQKSLSKLIGGTKGEIAAGVVLGLQDDIEKLLPLYKEAGYRRFKLKVQKGKERNRLELASRYVPTDELMFDGNGAYDEQDMDHLLSLDDLGLMMIEQPFRPGDYYLHAQLQKRMKTPICLDESIESYNDADQALRFQSCQVINIKIGRVGGMTEAIRIHHLCASKGVPVWCGGMLETGISRAHNIALASLSNFTIPGDISASNRYWHKDVIVPEVQLIKGMIHVPHRNGIGYDVNKAFLSTITTDVYFHEFK
ncbi:O-succinylbenzoate synthase [Pontibacillus litoralis JSM 072002]|uniref:o-succinylbenzoate synthase n=2 Tax=Pontibacillus TaxID=289201 RepID=A0A0A5G0W5_9BACI|nr:O-succinylbenzoate synthase [Pontibacillus litoralis JSM 072002]